MITRASKTGAPHLIPIEVGDIVGLTGKPTRFVVRELLGDGKHAVCERPDGFFGHSTSHSSYILVLKDLEKRYGTGLNGTAP